MISLALLVALAAPESLAAHCEGQWVQQEKPAAAKSLACSKHFLKYAYGRKVDAEAMSLDPGYGHRIELKLGVDDLRRMTHNLETACKGKDSPVESVCVRGIEYFGGMLDRKMSMSEGVNLGSFKPVLAKLLAGKAINGKDLYGNDPDLSWSALTLRKLRNAAYARHGYAFKSPDLNLFFYQERPGKLNLLPLPQMNHKTVKLTATDGANIKLIKKFEAALKKRR